MTIWRLPHSMRTRRLANALASSAQAGDLASRERDVVMLAADDPRRAADLVLALAELAAAALPPPPVPENDPALLAALRAAHSAYVRGLRLQWVVDGERDYQREKKRRRRQEIRLAQAAADVEPRARAG